MPFSIVIGGDAQPVSFSIVMGTTAGAAIPGVGPAGAATFVLDLESGAEVTYSWATDVHKPLNGLEQRVSLGDAPQQRYTASAFLVDGDERTVRSALLFAAATGQPFLLALPYEELQLSADAVGATLPVGSTALSDWASNPGQRAVVLAPAGELAYGVVQSADPTSVVLDPVPGAVAGKAGARFMPTVAVYLEPTQDLSRHPVTVSHWKIAAQSALFGYAGVDQMGVGAVVNTYDGFPLYDERIDVDETNDSSLLTLGEILDTGALPLAVGGASVVDQTRQIRIVSDEVADWQWFKRFCFTVAGRFLSFLLPTWRPDLVFHSNPGVD